MIRICLFLFLITTVSKVDAQSLQITSSNYDLKLPSASIDTEGITLSDGNEVIQTGSYSMPNEPDPSLGVYPLQNGAVIVRENIANFLFYDTYGRVVRSISNSTQNESGEAISEIAFDAAGKTIVLYNPKIMQDGTIGSRAKLVAKNRNPVDIFFSKDRALRTVQISSNGECIALASMKAGSSDQVMMLDRFGNNLGEIEFNQDVKGVSFSEDGLFVTIFSGGRAAVFEIESRERIGSTSFRNTSLLYANYSSKDNIIVAITGSGKEEFTDLEGHAVNIEARKIARKNIDGTITQIHQPRLYRTGSGRYELIGFDQTFAFRARF